MRNLGRPGSLRKTTQEFMLVAVGKARINELTKDSLFRSTAPFRTLRHEPLGFVDVGARGGIYEVVEPIAGLTSVLAFEPHLEEYRRLAAELRKDSPWARCRIEPLALSSEEQKATLNLISWPDNSSLLVPNTKLVKRYGMVKWVRVGGVPVQTTSLDKLLFGAHREKLNQGEFLKLDTQGTEFEILGGAERTITERSVAILTEVEFAELYVGQKLFSDIEHFLRAHGFSFYGFTTFHLRSCRKMDKKNELGRERVFQADAVFFKDPLPGGYYNGSLSNRGNQVLFVTAMLLGYYDFALELALKTWAVGEEANRIEKLVHRRASLPAENTRREMLSLVRRIGKSPESANIAAGRFVDKRRYYFDYSDVVSP